MKKAQIIICLTAVCVMTVFNVVSADTIRGINIDFVSIGNAGNAADTDGTPGCGAVNYNYRIGKYEITNNQWNIFTAAAGAPTGNDTFNSGSFPWNADSAYNTNGYYTGAQRPVDSVSWYEAAQFCNYLTSGNKSKGAYLFSGNNTNPGSFLGIDRVAAEATYGTIYILPTEKEWYKAAYYKSDDSSYSLYANGLNIARAPGDGWNYHGGYNNMPWNVGSGMQEQNGTFDMMGNVWEWNETQLYSFRNMRGGSWLNYSPNDVDTLAATYKNFYWTPVNEASNVGFRVASVPEPCSLVLLSLGGLALLRKKN